MITRSNIDKYELNRQLTELVGTSKSVEPICDGVEGLDRLDHLLAVQAPLPLLHPTAEVRQGLHQPVAVVGLAHNSRLMASITCGKYDHYLWASRFTTYIRVNVADILLTDWCCVMHACSPTDREASCEHAPEPGDIEAA